MITGWLNERGQTAERKLGRKVLLIGILALLMYLLAGCGPGPGAPMLRSAAGSGEGPLVPGCLNVSNSDTSFEFNRENYLTTWGSAGREGGAVGKYEGARRGFRDIDVDIQDDDLRAFAYGSLPDSAVFCRVYNAEPQRIYKIVENMIPEFGYRWEYRNRKEGLLSTDYIYRAHKPAELLSSLKCKNCEKQKPKTKWKDRFFIDIKPFNTGQSIVRVSRDVYIARRTKDGWSDYIKGTSVGYNEAVILNRITRNL